MIYLDNAATTKIAPEVLDAMLPYLQEQYGNAGTLYKLGRDANAAVLTARSQVAAMLNCKPENIVFTSGGSESNGLVFKGIVEHLHKIGKTHIITTEIEHDSLLKAANSMTKYGFDITYLKPDIFGTISVETLKDEITENTGLVSIMHTNNETGATNDIALISALCASENILFHSDCVQAAGFCKLDTSIMNGLAFASIASHKIHGPKGVGALYIQNRDLLLPLICGGAEQEHGLRGGTENVAGIVGFGAACELASSHLKDDIKIITSLKQLFLSTLLDATGEPLHDCGIFVNGPPCTCPSKILNLRIDGVSGETLLLLMDSKDICISSGSACRSHENEPSHVLTAMGLSSDDASSCIRISFSRLTTDEDVVNSARQLAVSISQLRNTDWSSII